MKPGDHVADRFVIETLARSAGMGAIFRACDQRTRSPVALKTTLGARHAEAQRLVREAELLRNISHPQIVAYVHHGHFEASPFLVLEWLDGEDLADRLERRGLNLEQSLALAERAARALSALHERGIVHGALEPENIFLVDRQLSHVKLIDFGRARRMDEAAPPDGGSSPDYLAPERVAGLEACSPQSDIYALGCVLFECLTGRPPFIGTTLVELFTEVVNREAPAPSSLRPDIPPEVDALVTALLSKLPEDRPRTARHALEWIDVVREALEAASDQPSVIRRTRDEDGRLGTEERLTTVAFVRKLAPLSAVRPDTARIEAPPLDRLGELAANHGCRVESLGEGVLILPSAPSQTAPRVARCALAIADGRDDLRVGVATHRHVTGDQVAWTLGEAIGGATALADREGARVWLDAGTVRLLDERFLCRRVEGGVALEGFEARGRSRARDLPLIGRHAELLWLDDALTRTIAPPAPRWVVIDGEAGVGKSRLERAWTERLEASSRDLDVMTARADPIGGAAYDLAAQLLRSGLRLPEQSDPNTRRRALHGVLATLSANIEEPDLRRLETLLGVAEAEADPASLEGSEDPRVVADVVERFFTAWMEVRASATDALVVVVEDLHWGDFASLRLLARVAGHLPETPLLFVGFARSGWRSRFADIEGLSPQSLILRGLPEGEARELVAAAGGRNLAAARVTEILQRADGNPQYLVELTRAARRGQRALPDTLLALAQARLDELAPEARRVLRAGSVYGEGFTVPALLALLGPWMLSRVEADLPALAEAGLLEARPDSAGHASYRFADAVLREAAYASLPAEDKPMAHRLAATWLETQGLRDPLVLAAHWRRSDEAGRAVAWLTSAAVVALAGHDFEGALFHVADALNLEPTDQARAALHTIAAEAHEWTGDELAREREARHALALAEPRSPEWFRAFGQALVAGARRHGGPAVERLCALLAQHLSLELPPSGPEVEALAHVACQHFATSATPRGHEFLRWAEMRRQRVGPHPRADAFLSLARAWATLSAGDVLGAYRHDAEALRWFEAAGDARQAAYAFIGVAFEEMRLGLYEAAERSLRQARERGRRLGLELLVGFAEHYLGMVLALCGEVSEGLTLERRALVLFEDRGFRRLQASALGYLARMELMVGQVDTARRFAEQSRAIGGPWPAVRAYADAMLSRTLIEQRRTGEAVRVAERAFREALDGQVNDSHRTLIEAAVAEAWLVDGQIEAASELATNAAERLRTQAAQMDDPKIARAYLERVPEHARLLHLAHDLRPEVLDRS